MAKEIENIFALASMVVILLLVVIFGLWIGSVMERAIFLINVRSEPASWIAYISGLAASGFLAYVIVSRWADGLWFWDKVDPL